MTPLRRRMTEDLQLRGYADPTIKAYLLAVSQLAKFYGVAPDQITEAQLRDYRSDPRAQAGRVAASQSFSVRGA